MRTSDFDYELPQELIAQEPAPVRDECKLLVLGREDGSIEDKVFHQIVDYLRPGDLLVANETRVLPSRLLGRKRGTGGECELLLLRETGRPDSPEHPSAAAIDSGASDAPQVREAYWEALVRPGKRLKPGSGAVIDFTDSQGNVALSAEVVDWASSDQGQKGERIVRLQTTHPSLDEALHAVGRSPLPPYIRGYAGDDEMYQTVYSRREGSAAAPTAGLHFTPELIDNIRDAGIDWKTVELEVGLDTFRVVDEEMAEDHVMHTELYTVPADTVRAIRECKERGGRVIAVGTTSVRSLESAAALADGNELLRPTERAATSLYIMPGYDFKVVDGLITNFHVPRSTLMMLVSAFSTRENLLHAYEHAKSSSYRFLSFGDAMLII